MTPRGFLGFFLLLQRFSKFFFIFKSTKLSWRFLENLPKVRNLQAESWGFLGFLLYLGVFQSFSSNSIPQKLFGGFWRTFLGFGTFKPNPGDFWDFSCSSECFKVFLHIQFNKGCLEVFGEPF